MMDVIQKIFRSQIVYRALVSLISAILVVVSVWHLPQSPATWFDEGISFGIANSLVHNGVYSLQVGPHSFVQERSFLITNNYPVLAPVALALYFGGANLTAPRIPMVLFLWLFSALSYFLVRRLYGKQYALLSLALIVTFVPFYGNGKAVLGEVPGLVYLLAGLLVWPKEYQPRRLLGAGILFGLSAATKPFFLIIAPALLCGELYRRYFLKGGSFWKRIAWTVGGAVPPLVLWVYTILPNFSFQGLQETLGYYSNSYAATDFFPQVLTNVKRFFTETTPVHFMLLGIVTVAAFFSRARRNKGVFELTEIVLLIFIAITLLWYLKTPGWYRYFFTAHVLLFLFFPAALGVVLSRWRTVAFSFVIFLVCIQFGYLLTKRHDPFYNSSAAKQIASTATKALTGEQAILVINAPSVAFLLPSNHVYQYLQINPTLHFGQSSLRAADGQPYQFILLNGSPDSVPILNLAPTIASSYFLIGQEEHYALYRYRL